MTSDDVTPDRIVMPGHELTADQMEAIRTRVAKATGLPLAVVARLAGSTEDELRAAADEVVKLTSRPSLTTRSRPVVGGAPGKAGPSEDDPLSDPVRLAAEIRKRLPY